jgi:hypothetical protein
MAVKLGEETEIKLTLKAIIAAVFVLVSGSFYVFAIDERLDILEMNTSTMQDRFVMHTDHDNDDVLLKIELLKRDIEYLNQQIGELKNDR